MSLEAINDGLFPEKKFEDITLYKKIEFPQPLHVGNTVWLEIGYAEIFDIQHYLLATETVPAHTQIIIRMNNVWNMESFRTFWTRTEGWVNFPHH